MFPIEQLRSHCIVHLPFVCTIRDTNKQCDNKVLIIYKENYTSFNLIPLFNVLQFSSFQIYAHFKSSNFILHFNFTH